MTRHRRFIAYAFAAAVGLLPGAAAHAQQMSLAMTGGPLNFAAPTVTDYTNGFVSDGTPLNYTLTLSAGAASTGTIQIKSTSANLGNGKALADLEWRRGDLAVWNAVTTANVTVQAVSVKVGTPVVNTIFFRVLLNWAADAPASYTANLTITLNVTTP